LGEEPKRGDPMHFIDSAKYWASDNPCFMGDDEKEESSDVPEQRTPYTGY